MKMSEDQNALPSYLLFSMALLVITDIEQKYNFICLFFLDGNE